MAAAMGAAQKYDLYSHEFRTTTHETYARMRAESPVHLQPGLDGETPIWFVTRYDDVVALLTDNERFVLDPALALTPEELAVRLADGVVPDPRVNENLLSKDGDDHRRLRRLVTKAFTPRMVEQLRPRIREIADELVDRVADRGHMELVDDFAFPLPIRVIAELLGIPVEDQDRFREWSNTFVLPPVTPELQEQAVRHTQEFVEYLDALFAERRAEPTDDLVSALVRAEDEGDHLSENELYSMVVLLVVAGHETTVSLITNAVHALLTHPDQLARLGADHALVPTAVDELLRFDSPVERTITRWVTTDCELGGRHLRRGDLVIAVVGSANRDAEQFADADSLDLGRADNKHVGFGRGPHYCLGAPLARLETEIALATLVDRLPGLRLAIAEDDLYWRPIPLFRSLASLPVAWDTQAGVLGRDG
jgi:cytochrome P450